jgi:hypothetical protein
MTRPNRHRIRRQIVELGIDTTAKGPVVHKELARAFWDRAVPELETVFDGVAGPDELLQLDRLEVDLGTIAGGGDWPLEFRKKLIAELARALAQFAAAPETVGEDERGAPLLVEPWRQLAFFLRYGRLPWWATRLAGDWNDLLSKGSDSDWRALCETIVSSPRARARLVYSLDDLLLAHAVRTWSGLPEGDRVLEQLTPPHLGADARRRWRRGFWMIVLNWIAIDGFRSPRGGPQLVRDVAMLRAIYESDSDQPAALLRLPVEGDEPTGRRRTVGNIDLPEPWRKWFASQGDAVPFDRTVTERCTDARSGEDRAPAVSVSQTRRSNKNWRDPEDEALYLDGTGVVLLHPFLEQLFFERGLLDRRTFRGLKARDRAVHLVGLLTYGRVDLPEHALVLAKVLCGAPLEDPLEPVPLDDDDVAACEGLLRAVLEHWTALRSSSTEWLRQQFFLREGKLEDVDSGWRLTIERHAQDVLLARLPWGFGVVALPWLTDRIFVHWLD